MPKRPQFRRAAAAVLPVALCAAVAGCAGADATGSQQAVAVTSTDTECTVSATEVPAGPVTFSVTNSGNQVTEFYLLNEDGVSIVGEVENIGPGISRDLVVQAEPGTYVTSCNPGMGDDGITGQLTVTGEAPATTGAAAEERQQSAATFQKYVRAQTAELLAGTKEFAAAFAAGDGNEARHLYPRVRAHWERIEPIAESFGDLDPKLDLREADLAEGETWTGWHAAEKDLWPPQGYRPMTPAERRAIARQLVADTRELRKRVAGLELSIDQVSNGAVELLSEVATSKVTGEEEYWSHTDLWDIDANLAGAAAMVDAVRPILTTQDPELERELDRRFADLRRELDQHRSGEGFVEYTELTPQQVRDLSAQVDALSEPLASLTATVLS